MKAWYLICLLFCIYSLSALIDERYDVTYNLESDNEPYHYSIQIPLAKIFKNKTKINLNEANDIKNYFSDYIDQFRSEYYNSSEFVETKKILLKQINSKKYFIFKNIFWLPVNSFNDFDLFVFSSSLESVNVAVFNNKSFEFSNLGVELEVNQIKILNKAYPYSSCLHLESNKFTCLNECIKKIKGANISKYFYNSSHDLLINLEYENKQAVKNERKCLRKCPDNGCKLIYFVPNAEKSNVTFKAHALISNFQFLISFISLTFLLLGISFNQLLSRFISLLKFKVRFIKLKKLRLRFNKFMRPKIGFRSIKIHLENYVSYLKVFFLVIELIICSILYYMVVKEYIYKRDHPFNKRISADLFKSNLSIVVCVPFKKINKSLETNFHEKTLLELEKETFISKNDLINKIYLDFLETKVKVEWHLNPKVMFLKENRCFQIKLYPFEARYLTLLSVSRLAISSKFLYDNSLETYLLPENQNFNTKIYLKQDSQDFIKKIKIKSRSNQRIKCNNYNMLYYNCDDKFTCIDTCFHRKTLRKFRNITLDFAVDKDRFTEEEWANLYPIELNASISDLLKESCYKKFINEDCYQVYFENQSTVGTSFYDHWTEKIDLNYDIVATYEEESSPYKLIIELLNIQSIFFNLNVNKLILIIFYYFKRNSKYKKFYLAVIYILCLTGFAFHLNFVFTEILSGELIDYQLFKILNSTKSAEIVFCLNYDTTLINPNYQMTYSYLNDATKNLKADDVFNRIEYLTKSNRWKTVDKKSNFKDKNIKVDSFYFLKNKCFKIKQDVTYFKNQFFFEPSSQVLKVFFNEPVDNIFSFTKKPGQMQFSKTHVFEYYSYKEKVFSYSINQELSSYDFDIIKNPLSFFHDENDPKDANEYLSQLIYRFNSKYNLHTQNLPSFKTNSLVIDDFLFDQYFRQVQNVTDRTSGNINYQGQYATSYVKEFLSDERMFTFGLIFYQKVTVVRNKVNKASIILNLISVLSIWLDFGVLEIYIYILKVKIIFNLIYRFLTRFRIYLSMKLKINVQ